jgi:hypothetical protein
MAQTLLQKMTSEQPPGQGTIEVEKLTTSASENG